MLRRQAGKLLRSYTATLSAERRVLMDRFRFADIARKVVGVGSVGTRTWVVLMLGRDTGDPLLLQVKEAEASVLEPYLGASRYRHHGRRVVEGQRLMQAASDILLGWDRAVGDGRSVDGLLRPPAVGQEGLGGRRGDEPRAMLLYGRFCGWTLARAHARSGDSVAIAAYLGTGDAFDRSDGRVRRVLRRPERAMTTPPSAGDRGSGEIVSHAGHASTASPDGPRGAREDVTRAVTASAPVRSGRGWSGRASDEAPGRARARETGSCDESSEEHDQAAGTRPH